MASFVAPVIISAIVASVLIFARSQARSSSRAVTFLASRLNCALVSLSAQAAILVTLNSAQRKLLTQPEAGVVYTLCAILFLVAESDVPSLVTAGQGTAAAMATNAAVRAKALDVLCEFVMCLSDVPPKGHIMHTALNTVALPLLLYSIGKFFIAFRQSPNKAAECWILCEMANSFADTVWCASETFGIPDGHWVYAACSWLLTAMASVLLLDAVGDASKAKQKETEAKAAKSENKGECEQRSVPAGRW